MTAEGMARRPSRRASTQLDHDPRGLDREVGDVDRRGAGESGAGSAATVATYQEPAIVLRPVVDHFSGGGSVREVRR
ncbi:MAG TPA: hypothetical protein VFT55_12865, partial [Planctomycetota bacterium]|nr:hypothetical protein [Planctomycetota bacterium]